MATDLFFYGTLRHPGLLEIVLGAAPQPSQIHAASLPGYAVHAVAEGPFPMLVQQEGARAAGLRISGLTPAQIARLDFYEGGFGYDLVDVTLQDGRAAQVYLCSPDRWQRHGAWDFDAWAAQWAQMSCHAAREVMAHMGKLSRDAVAQIFPQIRARAWSRVLGSRSQSGQGVFAGTVEVSDRRRAYTGYFGMDELRLRHAHFDGTMSEPLERSVFIAGDAALVLPYDPVRDRVLLVEQIRMGPLGRGDPEMWQFEPIAGRVDPGEEAEVTARREAREEAGLELGALEVVARGYASPGEFDGVFSYLRRHGRAARQRGGYRRVGERG